MFMVQVTEIVPSGNARAFDLGVAQELKARRVIAKGSFIICLFGIIDRFG